MISGNDLLQPFRTAHDVRCKAASVLLRLTQNPVTSNTDETTNTRRLARFLELLACVSGSGPLKAVEAIALSKLYDGDAWKDAVCAIGLGYHREALPPISNQDAIGTLVGTFGTSAVTFAFTLPALESSLFGAPAIQTETVYRLGQLGLQSAFSGLSERLCVWQKQISKHDFTEPVDGRRLRTVAALAAVHFKLTEKP